MNLGLLQLGDQRRNKRLGEYRRNIWPPTPGGTLPQSLWGLGPNSKAAYRFFLGNRGVSFERVNGTPCGTDTPSLSASLETICSFEGHDLVGLQPSMVLQRVLGVNRYGAGFLNYTARWRCGWRLGRWNNGPEGTVVGLF